MVIAADRTRGLAREAFTRILLIKPSSLGDVIHALPVLHGLRQLYPQATIDWLVAKPLLPLLEGQPGIGSLIPFDRKRFARVGRSWEVSRAFVSFVGELRRRRYQLVVDLQGLFRTGFLTRACGAPHRLGFRAAREGAWIFYNHHIQVDDPNTHAVDKNRAACLALGLQPCPSNFAYQTTQQSRAEAGSLLKRGGIPQAGRFVAVVPGARWETKIWPPGHFSKAIDLLGEQSSLPCVLLGGGEDVNRCRAIAQACASRPLDLAGKTSLPGLAALLARASCVLCHDSGAMHLAVAQQRPLVCLVGPTNAQRTGPYRRLDDVLSVGMPCSPCYLRKLTQCNHEHRCMTELTAEQVVEAVIRRLS